MNVGSFVGIVVGAGALFLATMGAVRADDGWIAYGGNPGLLSGHPTVSMVSEIIQVDVGDKKLTVDCHFVFKNDGPARRVRMGFPDIDDHRGEEPDEAKKPPVGALDSFRSYVDGKEVTTHLIRADKTEDVWHEKTVTFAAHSRVKVRDIYTTGVGAAGHVNGGYIHIIGYQLDTGASWKGPIGKVTVNVTFHRKHMKVPLKLAAFTEDSAKEVRMIADGKVLYKGPCKPTVQGRTVSFVCSHLKPGKKDNIFLYFDIGEL
ncbi:MAG TPA: hypothetical protein VKU00_14180 [Chthonomonadaceae bacterium]|nr:hypothetical protein [Chthonomonadaceae bacterium]